MGTGSFGRVLLARDSARGGALVALKVLAKATVLRLKQVEHTINEKNILAAVACPFVVRLHAFFKDNSNLYLAQEFLVGGELFSYLRRCGRFDEGRVLFYSGQVRLF